MAEDANTPGITAILGECAARAKERARTCFKFFQGIRVACALRGAFLLLRVGPARRYRGVDVAERLEHEKCLLVSFDGGCWSFQRAHG